jgi:hypothetical protein
VGPGCPAEVVPGTGYRRYASRQLYAGRLIALLRRLDMPLTDDFVRDVAVPFR